MPYGFMAVMGKMWHRTLPVWSLPVKRCCVLTSWYLNYGCTIWKTSPLFQAS